MDNSNLLIHRKPNMRGGYAEVITFAMEIPKGYIKEHGGKRQLLQIIRNKIANYVIKK